MCKKILLICAIFLLVGCKKIDNNDDYISFVNNCFNDNIITNDVALGYEYYVPKGVKKVHDYDYNQVFLFRDYSIYLYVDIISYFYKKELKYPDVLKDEYYQTINHDGKTGYLKIVKTENDYLVTILYNYSKVEVYTEEKDLDDVITISSIILNNIQYNKKMIEKILQGDLGEFSEFTYEVDKPDGASSNFSQYLEEYIQKEDDSNEELPDK